MRVIVAFAYSYCAYQQCLLALIEDALTLFDVGNLFDCVNGDGVCCAIDDCVLF